MNIKKWILLVIAILVTVGGTVLLGSYSYTKYYNPNNPNAPKSAEAESGYKSYVTSKVLDIKGKEPEELTTDRIALYQIMSNEYYSKEAMYKQDVMNGETRLFTIAIYKDAIRYTPDSTTVQIKYRYNVYIYNVDYIALQKIFLDKKYTDDDKLITDAAYPKLLINFFPITQKDDDEYDYTESLYYDSSRVDSNKITSNDGEEIYASALDSTTSLNLVDYNANPEYKVNDDDESIPMTCQFLVINGYKNKIANLDLFQNGAIMKIDAVVEGEVNYLLDESLLEEEMLDFNFTADDVDVDVSSYLQGNNTSTDILEVLNNYSKNIEGIKSFDGWVFGHYIWWQCLICFVVLGIISTGFYFALTYDFDEPKKTKKKVNKK